mmetsp:Transcript_7946/g.16108  ORF Transcript_7946/g.16108 Transcript_7946/m.16108 type:complete len:93 (+) Transcript_7946:561-839(+)
MFVAVHSTIKQRTARRARTEKDNDRPLGVDETEDEERVTLEGIFFFMTTRLLTDGGAEDYMKGTCYRYYVARASRPLGLSRQCAAAAAALFI